MSQDSSTQLCAEVRQALANDEAFMASRELWPSHLQRAEELCALLLLALLRPLQVSGGPLDVSVDIDCFFVHRSRLDCFEIFTDALAGPPPKGQAELLRMVDSLAILLGAEHVF